MILDRIVARTRETLAAAKEAVSEAALETQALATAAPRSMGAALRRGGVSLIAEVKKASPSRGLLAPDFDPVRLAKAYAGSGAAAISVLTDEPFFQGKLGYLSEVRQRLGPACPPLLRKDFILDRYQLLEARASGADAALLIVAILDDAQLHKLLDDAAKLGLSALVEVHDKAELERALAAGAAIVGVNNRDLRTFDVNIATTERLRPFIPRGIVVVSESGYHSAQDIKRAAACGVDAVLVGEALVTAPDVGAYTADLVRAGLGGSHA